MDKHIDYDLTNDDYFIGGSVVNDRFTHIIIDDTIILKTLPWNMFSGNIQSYIHLYEDRNSPLYLPWETCDRNNIRDSQTDGDRLNIPCPRCGKSVGQIWSLFLDESDPYHCVSSCECSDMFNNITEDEWVRHLRSNNNYLNGGTVNNRQYVRTFNTINLTPWNEDLSGIISSWNIISNIISDDLSTRNNPIINQSSFNGDLTVTTTFTSTTFQNIRQDTQRGFMNSIEELII